LARHPVLVITGSSWTTHTGWGSRLLRPCGVTSISLSERRRWARMEGGHGVAGGRKHSTVPAFLGAFLRSPCIRSLAASFFHPYFRAGRAYVCYLLGRGGRIIASLNETCTTRRLPPGQHRGVLMRRVIHIPSYNSLARFPPSRSSCLLAQLSGAQPPSRQGELAALANFFFVWRSRCRERGARAILSPVSRHVSPLHGRRVPHK